MSEFLKVWESFNKAAISPDADETQRNEMKMAFYGGAVTLFRLQMEIADRNLSEAEEYKLFESIRQEIFSFRPEEKCTNKH